MTEDAMDDVTMATLVDEGLGNSCYLLDLGDGSALVIDPPRDLRAVRAQAGKTGLRIRFVADTHLHADFLSGAGQLSHDEGAQVLAAAADGRAFGHRGLVDGERVDLGGLVLEAMVTPGHTDEHLSFVLRDDRALRGVFSGGSLIVGSAARTDLLGADRAEELARAQYASLRRLAALPEATALWPTHGAGSFCSAPPGADRISTIGRERATNPLLAIEDEDRFVIELLGSLGSYPPYFLRLAEANRRGPAIIDTAAGTRLRPLPVTEVRRLGRHGAVLVDVRPVLDWAAAHIPEALSIPLRAQFATWLGWLVPAETPLVIVRNADQDAEEIIWQALKIGYDHLAGELAGGMDAWTAEEQATASTEVITAERIGSRQVLDVRQLPEYTGGHLPGATHVELGAVAEAAAGLTPAPTVVMCGHGERAAGAASLLEHAGHRDLAVLTGGPQDWQRATGQHLETGS
jgi:glyoxylase-like metal-dependent hydrolase (beta-lactamase superfamily II)/rhodanese-related sulfurtransferase